VGHDRAVHATQKSVARQLSEFSAPDLEWRDPHLENQSVAGSAQLGATLERIDGKGYKAYRDIEGPWSFAEFTLFVDRVQADPFAAPSKLRVRVDLDIAQLPESVRENRVRETAAASWLARAFRRAIRRAAPRRTGTGKGGLISIDAGEQEVLERSAVVFGSSWVEARIEVGLPAAGRRALGHDAARLLIETLPEIVTTSWIDRTNSDDDDLLHFVHCIENQEAIRAELAPRGLVAFVGENSILPRLSGASEEPMKASGALPFETPSPFAVEFEVPHSDAGAPGQVWRGMGLPKGITLLVGGGYHGKSTLLRALERAVVPHIPGDGRETVVSDPDLVKIRAEDGRPISSVDIQGFIDHLPLRPGEAKSRDTRTFSTPDASGSTSQAANIAEAIEAGATGLLLDEDTSATNFMVRDARMQALIHPKDEPITPFIDRVRELYANFGISTVLVMGGSGDYFEVADNVIEMKSYQPRDATERAKHIASQSSASRTRGTILPMELPRARVLLSEGFDARRGQRDVKFSSRDCEQIVYGTTEIDLRGVEQLFDPSQTRAIASTIHIVADRLTREGRTLAQILDALEDLLDAEGLDALAPFHRAGHHPGALARPRRFEIAAALNRMRTLRIAKPD
jgi:predicted ABC-class ATPase